jgi:PIN domain nuclease of toxin-antitoxin system
MTAALADTHAALWYLAAPHRLSDTASRALGEAVQNGEGIGISAISLVEVRYLVEKGRINAAWWDRLWAAVHQPDGPFLVWPVDEEVAWALARIPRESVPDMPDRILAATALRYRVPLVTRDGPLRACGVETIW